VYSTYQETDDVEFKKKTLKHVHDNY